MTNIIGRIIDGKYRIVRLLGEGGMAQVFEAAHTTLSRRVAVKILRPVLTSTPDAMNRFLLEAKTAAKLDHPNVVQIFDVGVQEDGIIYIVMELLRGQTLSNLIEEKGRLSAARVVPIVLQVLSALNAAHSLGIIHRDLKPDNVFLAVDARMREEVKLLDFGIAKIQGAPEESTKLTRTGMVMGTPHYLSPEQARGSKDVDARIDIWAVGIMMYEMLSGNVAFDGTSYNEVLGNILMEQAAPLREIVPSIPEEIAAVVDKAMAKDRELRYPTVARMIRDLMPIHDRGGYELMSTVVSNALHHTVPATPPAGTSSGNLELPAVLSITPSPWGESFEDLDTLISAKYRRYHMPFVAWIGLGALAFVIAVVTLVMMLASDDPKESVGTDASPDTAAALASASSEPAATQETSAKDSEPPTEVRIGVEGLPGGAQVFIAGKPMPLPLTLPYSTQPVILKVQARGYEAFEKAIVPNADQALTVDMVKKSISSRVNRGGAGEGPKNSGTNRGQGTKAKSGKVWAKNPFGD